MGVAFLEQITARQARSLSSPGMVWTDMVAGEFKDRLVVWERSKGIVNIIMGQGEIVSHWRVDQILANAMLGMVVVLVIGPAYHLSS